MAADDKVEKKPAASFSAFTVSVEKMKETRLTVSLEKKKEEMKQAPPSSSVAQMVSKWALYNAVVLLGNLAFTYAADQLHVTLPWMREGPELTGAAAAEVGIITVCGLVLCVPVQAAAAALALLLPADSSNRRRLALAYVAFAATAAVHLMLARDVTLFLAADPGDIFLWIAGTADIVFFAVGDVSCVLAILGRGPYANLLPLLIDLITFSKS